MILDLGFEQYLARVDADGSERIWPGLANSRDGYSQSFSKWYARFNRKEQKAMDNLRSLGDM